MIPEDEQGSITRWIIALQDGDDREAPVQGLWARYFDKMTRKARALMGGAPHASVDEEDVALSAIENVCRGLANGRYPDVCNRGDLAKLLATVTRRRAANQIRNQKRAKRGGGREIGSHALNGEDSESGIGMGQFPSPGLTPDRTASEREELERLLELLSDESLRLMALLKLEGYTNEQIAVGLDCGVRSVERGLSKIRNVWERELEKF